MKKDLTQVIREWKVQTRSLKRFFPRLVEFLCFYTFATRIFFNIAERLNAEGVCRKSGLELLISLAYLYKYAY